MILLIDNYDSFTYNLFQYFGELGETVKVVRNDQITLEEIKEINPDQIVLSPGPGRPENAGLLIDIIKTFYKDIPILGICLGHQGIGYAFGAKVVRANNIMHGKTSLLTTTKGSIFASFADSIEVMRYHSLVIQKDTLPNEFEVLAYSKDDNEIMAIKHQKYPLYGFQFHPESVGTKVGLSLLKQFLAESRKEVIS